MSRYPAAVTGGLAGIWSGLLGVGGGIVMVPLLTLWQRLDHRRAVATSLIAIVPVALAGVLGYALGGAVDWAVGLALGLGGVVGGQVGAWLVPRLPVAVLQLAFAALLVYSAWRLAVPADYAAVGTAAPPGSDAQPWALLAGVGLAAGLLAGLMGVGGGVILVPALVLLAGESIDVARGTSLMAVVLTAVAASWSNVRAARADVAVGITAGAAGAPAALIGSWLGQWLAEGIVAVLFALLMVYAAGQMVWRAWRHRPREQDDSAAAATG